MNKYYHPNNPRQTIQVGKGYAWWVLVFGCFWFWVKGMIARGFLVWGLSIITLGLSWFFVPFFAFKWQEQHLTEKGYIKTI